MYVRRFVSSLIAREWINIFSRNLVCLFLKTRKRAQEGQNTGKVSRIRVPVRAVPIARKISKIEERRQGQSCLPRRGDYREKEQNREKLSCIRVPVKMVPVARKLSTIEERPQDQNCFEEEITCSKVTNPNICSGFESR
jgi:hypothetical protein